MSMFSKRAAVFTGDPAFNPFERPSMPLASLALDGILGGGGSGAVDTVTAMGLPTVYRCVSVLSTVAASCNLQEVDRTGAAVDWQDWCNLQSYTPYEMTELMVTHMAGWGNFFALKVTGRLSTDLIDLQPIFPGNVSVMRVGGKKIFRVRTKDGDPQIAGGQASGYTDYDESQVFHVPFLGYDGLQGMSPLSWAAQTIGTAASADALAGRFYSKGQTLGGIIKVKVPLADQSQADAIKHQWQNSHGGLAGNGGVAVLDSETDFQPITIAPDNLQFLQSREWQAQEIARLFGVPLTMLSFGQTGYGNAIETQQIGFVSYTLRAYTDRIEQRLSREFQPRGRKVAYNLDELMRGTLTERYAAYNTAIVGGWLQPAEARASENMQAKPGLAYFQEPSAVNGVMTTPPMFPNGQAPEPPAPPAQPPAGTDNEDDNQND